MLLLKDKLQHFIDIYKDKLTDAVNTTKYKTDEEQTIHVEQITNASRGDSSGRQWLILTINMYLQKLVTTYDKGKIKELVLSEYKTFLNKRYPILSGEYIGYYQLLDLYMTEDDKKHIYTINLDDLSGMDEFTELMYSVCYGNDLLEPLLKLRVNNIEVHGTQMIRIETPDGHWKTIDEYRFHKDYEIKKVANKIINLNLNDKEDITEENCMQEGQTYDGKRVSIALKPGNKKHMIFIKNYDAFNKRTMEDLVNQGEITPEMYKELKVYAKGRANMIFIGGINAGKSTVMDAYATLMASLSPNLKFGMVEDDFDSKFSELCPDNDIVNLRATKKYSINDQFIRMLRMNRDVVSIPEIRSYEVLQLINAMTRGASGSFANLQTSDVYNLIDNMAWMALESGMQMDIKLLRSRIVSAIDIVVRVKQDQYGRNRIVDNINEIVKDRNNYDIPFHVNTIFEQDVDTGEVKKVGNISKDLINKFMYYNCPRDDIKSILREDLSKDGAN